MEKKVYCISGLGADKRIFQKLQLNGYKPEFLEWLLPEADESLRDYAKRMSDAINDEMPVLMGVSFGGMVAIEIAKLRPVDKIILISSIEKGVELPRWMRWCGKLHLVRRLPEKPLGNFRAFKLLRPIQNYFLGAQSEEEKRIANEFRDTVNPKYLKWSLQQVFDWNNDFHPPNLYHLHGTRDHIFPVKKVKPTHTIDGAGHFMVFNRHEEVSRILREILGT
jgi:pimeloyl-ACP methyl ester carboxylesterase